MNKPEVVWSNKDKDVKITISLESSNGRLFFAGVGVRLSTGKEMSRHSADVLEDVMKWAVMGGARFLMDDAIFLKKAYQAEVEKLK